VARRKGVSRTGQAPPERDRAEQRERNEQGTGPAP